MWSTRVQPCFLSILIGQSNRATKYFCFLFKLLVFLSTSYCSFVYYKLRYIIVEQWRSTSRQNSAKSNSELHWCCTLHISAHATSPVVDCTHVGSAPANLKDLVRVAQENSTNQTADILVEDQLQPLRLGNSFPGVKTCTNQTAEPSMGHSFCK